MTPERARGILDASRFVSNIGPFSDQIDAVMAKGEREEVLKVWETLPGYTCFVDALNYIAAGKAEDWAVLSKR
jgi:hypothetical protein